MTLGADVALIIKFLREQVRVPHRRQINRAHISQCRVNSPTHLSHTPFDNIAELLIVDVIVLSPN